MDFKTDTSANSGDMVLDDLARGHLKDVSSSSPVAEVASVPVSDPAVASPDRYEPVEVPPGRQPRKVIDLPSAKVIEPPLCAPRLDIRRPPKANRKPTVPPPEPTTPRSYLAAQVALAAFTAVLVGIVAGWMLT